MKWAEVIMVRAAPSSLRVLNTALEDLMDQTAMVQEHEAILLFCRENLDSDLCVVLFHSKKRAGPGASPLGLHLAAAFKEVGLVSHTIWNQIKAWGKAPNLDAPD